VFSGPDGQQDDILIMYQDISKIISPLDLHIVQLSLTSDMLWRMRLNNGMDVMIGNKDVLLRIQHFVQVYDKVFADERQASYIDLRYANGLAVKWQDTTRDTHD
jgi:cell division protein FtsQ